MAAKSKLFTVLALFFTILALTLLVISFASSKWMASSEDSGFLNMGLWSVCFKQYLPPPWSFVNKYYEGCWWTLDKEMDDIRHFLFPPWFKATQGLVTFSLVLVILSVICQIVNAINCFPYSRYRRQIRLGLSVTATVMLLLAAVFLGVAIILFGVKAENERTWLQDPDNNFLSWSFGLAIGATLVTVLAAMCQLLEFFRLRSEEGLWGSAEPRVYLTNRPPPDSNYAYDSGKGGSLAKKPVVDSYVGQPEYARKYNNAEPEPVFKVSGAGEVYINRLADREDFSERNDYRDHRRNYNDDAGYRNGLRNGYPQSSSPSSYPDYQRNVRGDGGGSGGRNEGVQDGRRRNEEEEEEEEDVTTEEEGVGDDYEASKSVRHPVLPEYVPKNKTMNKSRPDVEESDSKQGRTARRQKGEESADSDDVIDRKTKKKSRSTSAGKGDKKTTSRSRSGSSKKKKTKKKKDDDSYDSEDDAGKYSDADLDTKKKEQQKKKKKRYESSDDERSRSRSRNRRRSSTKRSRSRDLATSRSDSLAGSDDAGSERSRTRARHKEGGNKHPSLSRNSSGKKKRAASKDRSASKDRLSEADGRRKKQSGASSDEGSKYSSSRHHQRTRSKGGRGESDVERKTRTRDFSDTESVRSKQSRRTGEKPKGTYSSYYEY